MHIQRRTRPSRDISASAIRRPPALGLKAKAPNRFAATVQAAQPAPRPEIDAYQKGYRDGTERSRVMMLDLARALEDALAVGWPDETEPRNAQWRRLIWRARRTPK